MLADAHECAEGASPTRMLGAARATRPALRALLFCIDPTCAFPLLLRPPLHRSIEKVFADEVSEATEPRSTQPRHQGHMAVVALRSGRGDRVLARAHMAMAALLMMMMMHRAPACRPPIRTRFRLRPPFLPRAPKNLA